MEYPAKGSTSGYWQLGKEAWRDNGQSCGWAEPTKIYEIHDPMLDALMHPSVLELHAVRVIRTPHGHERQLHLKVRKMCGRKEVVADVLVYTGPR